MALPGSSGKVAGGFGSFKSKEHQEHVIILHVNAAGNGWRPVLRPAIAFGGYGIAFGILTKHSEWSPRQRKTIKLYWEIIVFSYQTVLK